MAKKKRLTPLPFEAVQAASEWLLERFDQGLSCVENPTNHIPGYVEGGVAPRLTRPRSSRIRPRSFNFAYMNQSSWIKSLRMGDIHPYETIPYEIIHVEPRYFPDLNKWTFITRYQGHTFYVSINDELLPEHYENEVARRLIEQFRNWDRNDEIERPRF